MGFCGSYIGFSRARIHITRQLRGMDVWELTDHLVFIEIWFPRGLRFTEGARGLGGRKDSPTEKILKVKVSSSSGEVVEYMEHSGEHGGRFTTGTRC